VTEPLRALVGIHARTRLRVALVALVVLVGGGGCARPAPLAVENARVEGVVVRLTGSDGRVGTWWAAPGASGVAEADAWPELEPTRIEILLDDEACTLLFQTDSPAQSYRLGADGSVNTGDWAGQRVALPVTSRCVGR
jgi:hypothetical protein